MVYNVTKDFNPYIPYDPANAPVIFSRDASLIQGGTKIKISNLPTEGTLQLFTTGQAPTNVTSGTIISAADLTANKLRYKNMKFV